MSKQPKHTPGPWEVHGGGIFGPGPPKTYMDVAEVEVEDGMYCQGCPAGLVIENEADAHLIAAAPDLYDALEKARDIVDRRFGPPGTNKIDADLLQEIDDALASARGEGK